VSADENSEDSEENKNSTPVGDSYLQDDSDEVVDRKSKKKQKDKK
jgi:hypothetical protein